ncbi:uncharacterized protein GLRG_09278, partial [Colletotrichum graminicola M1.001]
EDGINGGSIYCGNRPEWGGERGDSALPCGFGKVGSRLGAAARIERRGWMGSGGGCGRRRRNK